MVPRREAGLGKGAGVTRSRVAASRMLRALESAARDHRHHMSFVFADGVAFANQMTSLGIAGGEAALPIGVINTKDRRVFQPLTSIDKGAHARRGCARPDQGRAADRAPSPQTPCGST